MSNIGFIGGGQMGEALIKGIISSNLYSAESIYVAEPNPDRRDYLSNTYNLNTLDNSSDLCVKCNVIILAVKPQIMAQVINGLHNEITEDHLLISIAAGITLSFFENSLSYLKRPKVIRVMPNTPALVGESATALSINKNVSQEELDATELLFNKIGSTVVLDEKLMDAVTGLSGSGPAYVFTFVEALIDAGVAQGFDRKVARQLTLQTIQGSVKLLQEGEEHPAVERAKVTSPGGTAITGLQVLFKEGFQGIVMKAVGAAVDRAKALGAK